MLALTAFTAQERHLARTGGKPLIETSLFTTRAFPAALVTSALFFAAVNGLVLVIVVHLQTGIGANALTAGLTLLPWSLGLGAASYLAGSRLIPRYGDRIMFAGLAALLLGTGAAISAYLATGPGHYPALLLPGLAVCGLGTGLFTPAFFTSALHHVRPQEIGSAAGLLNAVQQLGATLGIAVLGTLFFSRDIPPTPSGASRAAEAAFVIAGVILAATTAAATAMTRTAGRSMTGNSPPP